LDPRSGFERAVGGAAVGGCRKTGVDGSQRRPATARRPKRNRRDNDDRAESPVHSAGQHASKGTARRPATSELEATLLGRYRLEHVRPSDPIPRARLAKPSTLEVTAMRSSASARSKTTASVACSNRRRRQQPVFDLLANATLGNLQQRRDLGGSEGERS
jgi:hypothetical protein